MLKLYHFLFKILLMLPFLGIINSSFMNKFSKLQKIINDCIYIAFTVLCGFIIIFFSAYGRYDIYLFTMSKNVPLAFSANSFNLMFGFFISIVLIFINIVFQNSFTYLNLADKYKLYNKQFASIFFFCILLSFSHSILLTVFIYISVVISSYFLITNPDLRDFRKRYSVPFSTSFISCIFFMCILGFYYKYTGNTFFTLHNIDKLATIPSYWLAVVFVLLILPNFCAPIYLIFKEKFYYEDFLAIFIIFFIPFVFCSTFLFFKVAYFVFHNSLNSVGIYFLCTNIFVVLLFLASCFFAIKNIKNNLKFVLLYSISCFMIFLSQILFIHSNVELSYVFSSFLFFIMLLTLAVLSYSSILFLLLKCGITDTNILYKYSRNEMHFHIVCLFLPILMLIVSFFDFFNLKNFNIVYLINAIEIVAVFGMCLYYVVSSINKQIKDNNKKPKNIQNINKLIFFIPQITLFIIFVCLILLKGQIAEFILFYK